MRYIKTKEEHLIKEELSINVGWKQVVIGLCIFVAYKNFFPEKKKITLGEMNTIVSSIDSKPNMDELTIINNIKNTLINDISKEKDISEDRKRVILNGINKIPFVMVDTETINLITGEENTLGCYFGYMGDNNKPVTIILINRERLKGVHFGETLLHEMRHLVDDLLSDGIDDYSELSNIVELLDKDIVLRNKEGEKKIRNKLNDYVDIMVKYTVDPEDLNDPEVKELADKIKDDYFKIIYLNKKNLDYLTSSSEIYARFHGLKRWMIKNGYLDDINSEITQEIIINMMRSKEMFDTDTARKDFFQLLFYMNIDFTGKTKSDLTKANSIVANYKDYMSNKKPA